MTLCLTWCLQLCDGPHQPLEGP
uniref:Uncharacterized protein n=1 Tax=Arundo donax TaxID=35708 RepID=A0A0A9F2V8_ARUDO